MEKRFSTWMRFANGNYFWLGDVMAKNKTQAKRMAHDSEILKNVRDISIDPNYTMMAGAPTGFDSWEEKEKWAQRASLDARHAMAMKHNIEEYSWFEESREMHSDGEVFD